MLTRCPDCATTFRVTPEQLKTRQGRVRCGECAAVFNALDSLIEETVVLVPEEAALPAETTVATPAPESPEPDSESSLDQDSGTGQEATEIPASTTPPEEPAAPEFEPLLHEAPPRRAWPWVLGMVAAVTVLAAQATLHFRTELAVLHPWAKPALVAACDALGCKLNLPRKPELLGIDASDLAPGDGSKLLLTATLRNRAPFAQEYPHLELTLTDTADQPLLRRILAPADYLPAGATTPTGFAAGADLGVTLSVDTSGVPAAGYRLYIFYP